MELVGEEAARRDRRRLSPFPDVRRLSPDELARVQLAGADEWFLEGDGTPIGPLSTDEIKERWLAHQLAPESRCWGVGFPGWMPLSRIGALMRALGPRPSQPAAVEPPAPEPVKPPPPALVKPPPPELVKPPPQAPVTVTVTAFPKAPRPPPEPKPAAPALSPHRRSQPLAIRVEPAPANTARRTLRALAGAVVGLCAVAALIAVMTGPPLLSPPKPRAVVTASPIVVAPPPAPAAPRRHPAEHRAKKPAPAAEGAASRNFPEADAAFDDVFGPAEAAKPTAARPRTVYIPPAPPAP